MKFEEFFLLLKEIAAASPPPSAKLMAAAGRRKRDYDEDELDDGYIDIEMDKVSKKKRGETEISEDEDYDFSWTRTSGFRGGGAVTALTTDVDEDEEPLLNPNTVTSKQVENYYLDSDRGAEEITRKFFVLLGDRRLLLNRELPTILGIILSHAMYAEDDVLFDAIFDLDVSVDSLTSAIESSEFSIEAGYDGSYSDKKFGHKPEVSAYIKKWIKDKLRFSSEDELIEFIRRYNAGASTTKLMDIKKMEDSVIVLRRILANAIRTRNEELTRLIITIDFYDVEWQSLIIYPFEGEDEDEPESILSLIIKERAERLIDIILEHVKIREIEHLKSALRITADSIREKVINAWLNS